MKRFALPGEELGTLKRYQYDLVNLMNAYQTWLALFGECDCGEQHRCDRCAPIELLEAVFGHMASEIGRLASDNPETN